MDLKLNDILHLTDEEIRNSKIELNISAGKYGDSYIDVWLGLDEEAKSNGKNKISYWPWYGKSHNFYEGQLVFSFIKKSYNEWLFISAGKVLSIPDDDRAEVEILEQYKPLFGRLILNYYKGNTMGRYTFKLSHLNGQETVKEILPCLYSGETFNGYDNVYLPFKKLKDVFDGKIMPTYAEALKKITGVYCLTDTNNGKLYIGSATGTEGVAQRWGNYLSSKHGGNVKLRKLYEEKGDEYFEKYFTFTLIEYFGLSYDPDRIKEREQYWKKCFDTIKNGYNDN